MWSLDYSSTITFLFSGWSALWIRAISSSLHFPTPAYSCIWNGDLFTFLCVHSHVCLFIDRGQSTCRQGRSCWAGPSIKIISSNNVSLALIGPPSFFINTYPSFGKQMINLDDDVLDCLGVKRQSRWSLWRGRLELIFYPKKQWTGDEWIRSERSMNDRWTTNEWLKNNQWKTMER